MSGSAFTMAERVKWDASEPGWRRLQQQAKWNNHLLWLAPLLWVVNTGMLVLIDLAGVGKLRPPTFSMIVYLAAILVLLGVMRWQYTGSGWPRPSSCVSCKPRFRPPSRPP